jgi:hypothetical protein
MVRDDMPVAQRAEVNSDMATRVGSTTFPMSTCWHNVLRQCKSTIQDDGGVLMAISDVIFVAALAQTDCSGT